MRRAMVAATLCCTMLGCGPEMESEMEPDEAVESTASAVADPIDEDLVITVKHAFLVRAVDQVVTEKVIKDGSKVKWEPGAQKRVEITRIDSNTYHVDLDLKRNEGVFKPRIDVTFDMSIGCNWRTGEVSFTIENENVDAIVSGALDTITLGILDDIADALADQQFQKALRKGFAEPLDLDAGEFCPLIEINSSVNAVLQFGRFNNCPTEGATKTLACPSATPLGSIQQICVNGRWETDRRDCGVCNPGATKRMPCTGNTHGDKNYVCTSRRTWRLVNSFCETNTPPGGDPL